MHALLLLNALSRYLLPEVQRDTYLADALRAVCTLPAGRELTSLLCTIMADHITSKLNPDSNLLLV